MNVFERPREPIVKVNLLWILIGLLSGIKINLFGEIYIGEIAAIIYAPFLIALNYPPKFERWLVMATFIWMAMQGVSDYYNHNDFESSLKGVFAPLLFAISVVVLSLSFRKNFARAAAFFVGFTLAKLLFLFISPTPEFLFEPWKWGYGEIVFGIILAVVSFYIRLNLISLIGVFLAFGAISIYENARSMAFLPIMGLILYSYSHSLSWQIIKKQLQGKWGVLALISGAILISVGLNALLGVVFTSKIVLDQMPPEARFKYERQGQSDVGVLLAGRSEILVSAKAFADKPLLGHGSWAKDDGGYLELYRSLKNENHIGLTDNVERIEGDLIPYHSFLLGGLVWSGIAGGLVWCLLIWRLLKLFLSEGHRMPVFFHFTVVNYLWTILFSPFGASNRYTAAVNFAILFAVSSRKVKFAATK